ncbi:MAG: hypothetical protein JNN01_22795, partial [Opitutaceae bacterium]|nr:hypothetical protein [Opitutaceae bacterium]
MDVENVEQSTLNKLYLIVLGVVGLLSLGTVALCHWTAGCCADLIPEAAALLLLIVAELYFLVKRSRSGSQRDPEEHFKRRDLEEICRFFALAILIGFYVVLRLGWTDPTNRYRLILVIAVWALAFLSLGGLLGFIFGIPRSLVGSAADRQAEASRLGSGDTKRNYQTNTNFERVSDWLTQIIIGGTVTQLALMPQYLSDLGEYFSRAIFPSGFVDLVSLKASPWNLIGAGSTVYFTITGFLGSYLLTRLYLTAALERADGSKSSKVAQLSKITHSELAALEAAPLSFDCEQIEFDPIARSAAKNIVTVALEQLSHWRDLRAWAKAQFVEGNPKASIEGYIRALELNPSDAETHLGYGYALRKTKAFHYQVVLAQLELARASIMLATPHTLRTTIYTSLIYWNLYDESPRSFLTALRNACEYRKFAEIHPELASVNEPSILFNVACAYGQAYTWLEQSTK